MMRIMVILVGVLPIVGCLASEDSAPGSLSDPAGIRSPEAGTMHMGPAGACPYALWFEPRLFQDVWELAHENGWERSVVAQNGLPVTASEVPLSYPSFVIASFSFVTSDLGRFEHADAAGRLVIFADARGDVMFGAHVPTTTSNDDVRRVASEFLLVVSTASPGAIDDTVADLVTSRRSAEYHGPRVVGDGMEVLLPIDLDIGGAWHVHGLGSEPSRLHVDTAEYSNDAGLAATVAFPVHRVVLPGTDPAWLEAFGSGWVRLSVRDSETPDDADVRRLVTGAFEAADAPSPTFANWTHIDGVC